MRGSFFGWVALAVMLVATVLTLSGCGGSGAKCNAACQQTFMTWVKRGSVGTPPPAAISYCKVYPDSSLCP